MRGPSATKSSLTRLMKPEELLHMLCLLDEIFLLFLIL